MQQPQQMQGGLGSLQDPRQGYFLGKLVKKAGRAVKKVVKSPIGKLALLGGGAYLLGGSSMLGGGGLRGGLGNFTNLFAKAKAGLGTGGRFSTLGDMFRVGGKEGAKFSIPRMLAGGLGATAIAAPFLMGGDEEVEEDVEILLQLLTLLFHGKTKQRYLNSHRLEIIYMLTTWMLCFLMTIG